VTILRRGPSARPVKPSGRTTRREGRPPPREGPSPAGGRRGDRLRLRLAGPSSKLQSLNGFSRRVLPLLALGLLAHVPSRAVAAGAPITILTATSRREIVPSLRGSWELVPIEEVLAGSGVKVTSDPRGGAATLALGGHEVALYDRKSLASVDGDLRLLSTAVTRDEGRWLVPVDALPRLLSPLLGTPVEWRAAERVLVLGKVAVPRVAVSTYVSGDLVRVVFEASEPVPFRVQQEEGRVTVAVPRDLLDVALSPARLAGGIVESVQFVGGRDNVFAVHLGPRFRDLKASEQSQPSRLVLELHGPPLLPGAAPPERPGAPAAAAARPAPASTAPEPRGERVHTVVIDPGHGGEEVGAKGPAGALEKDVSLAIARKLRAELVNGGLSVFLTRDRDALVPLDDRSAIANNYKADLFVSIHANASRARGARGSEVYFLSYQASDDESRRIAQAEGAAEPPSSVAPNSDLALILWDMAQAEHLEESSALASRVQEELAAVTGSEGRGVKQAPFRVLVGASMPAILVETAFLSNPEEEKLLTSDAYQAKIAAAVARGIQRYRRERP
jgi:N-acetylmuramoyl-L-alanine amidase